MPDQPTYRPTTDAEREAIRAISPARVTYLPGSPDKRFARDIQYQATTTGNITERQAEYLRRLLHRYRRQIRGWERLLAASKAATGEA